MVSKPSSKRKNSSTQRPEDSADETSTSRHFSGEVQTHGYRLHAHNRDWRTEEAYPERIAAMRTSDRSPGRGKPTHIGPSTSSQTNKQLIGVVTIAMTVGTLTSPCYTDVSPQPRRALKEAWLTASSHFLVSSNMAKNGVCQIEIRRASPLRRARLGSCPISSRKRSANENAIIVGTSSAKMITAVR